MKNEKKKLRKAIRNILMDMDRSDYLKESRAIKKNLFETDVWKRSDIIGVTISIFPEVDTYALIEQAWKMGKTVAVPKCIPATKEMIFFQIQYFNELEKGYFGLFEPDEEKVEAIEKEKIQLLIVPGVVFSRNGHRIGQGGGYYDRFLQNFRGKRISLAFQDQIVDDIPVEKHDERVELIVTEKEVIDCGN
ncbi:5-formyltetrahydrofolate cyclo-ligase [Fervidibacillus halotolerans]|uniref:5-formyltetrahydrofolate cyclo-ligase n=1 Tax=Fervidibacillus halotolerans TaxID=2980027 RepID=A0A9E8LY69_9BACI|nr:5-formyltetrahydrofolate cyclo-ligase [Fervidibacillus halotolerans]WAA11465.1 5-formyltetrahydrofolate cyclo-ligase [Fervidibacillus halotolerans]